MMEFFKNFAWWNNELFSTANINLSNCNSLYVYNTVDQLTTQILTAINYVCHFKWEAIMSTFCQAVDSTFCFIFRRNAPTNTKSWTINKPPNIFPTSILKSGHVACITDGNMGNLFIYIPPKKHVILICGKGTCSK